MLPNYYHLMLVVGGWLLQMSHIFRKRLSSLPFRHQRMLHLSQQSHINAEKFRYDDYLAIPVIMLLSGLMRGWVNIATFFGWGILILVCWNTTLSGSGVHKAVYVHVAILSYTYVVSVLWLGHSVLNWNYFVCFGFWSIWGGSIRGWFPLIGWQVPGVC